MSTPVPAGFGSEGGVASASAIGTMNSSKPPNTSSAFCHPALSISATANGANSNRPHPAGHRPGPNRQRAIALGQQLAERRDHQIERAAGKTESDQHAGGDLQQIGRASR